MTVIQIKRAYETSEPIDGYRILVDRLWPRGIPKRTFPLDDWARNIAPTVESRKAFGHVAENLDTFRARYLEELQQNPEAAAFSELVAEKLRHGNVTLVYAAHDESVNHAVILRDWLQQQLRISDHEAAPVMSASR